MHDRSPVPTAPNAVLPATSLDTGQVDVQVDLGRTLNLAMAHNAVPLVQRLRLSNRTANPLADLVIRVDLRPEVSDPWEARIAELDGQATFNFDALNLPLRLERVAAAQEREVVQLWVEVLQGSRPLLRRCYPLELLAFNEWNGRSTLPQLLAAFVQPNHPAVSEVLARTKAVLERQTGDPSFSGYQSRDPGRVRSIATALYEAVQELGVTYANPPASFEDTGQKIRTPEQILSERIGTCLDLTVLVASCLEQVGLNPWLVLVKGHAFPGFWLAEQSLPYSCTDDRLQLLKVGELEGICFFDVSAMAAKPRVPFSLAERAARAALDAAEGFLFAIDVRAARVERILPLPSRYSKDGCSVVEAPIRATAPAQPGPRSFAQGGSPRPAPVALPSRVNRWKERLLDISLRNRLLNVRETKKTIQLECPDLASLEDALALGRGFRLLPKAEVLSSGDPRDARLLDARTGEDSRRAFLLEQLQHHRIHSTLADTELDRRQLEISREAKLSLEESGVNTLFLALGCVIWHESPTAEQPRVAPLILVPVEISRRSARDAFELQRIDEETRVNVTLLEKLRKDHGIEIPELADEIPQDDAGVDVPLILRLFRAAVLNLPRWHIEERAYLGHFSFTKLLMWHDLEKGAESLLRNDVIRHLATGTEGGFPNQGEFPAPENLDEQRHPADTFCPVDADSTQLAAVFAAEGGKTFVLEGPPGTGKSQTITNLISQCLAGGKTVLFVSEKMAALDVVHRRLEAVGLGEFSLELHSNKARKKEVLDRLGRSWDALGSKEWSDWDERASDLHATRHRLNHYVTALHKRREIGLSAFQAISQLIGLRNAPRVPIALGPGAVTRERFKALEDTISRVQAAAEPLGEVSLHPFRSVNRTDWSPASQEAAMDAVRMADEAAEELGRRAPACAKVIQADEYPMSSAELTDHRNLADLLLRSPAPATGLLEGRDWPTTRRDVSEWIAHGRRRDELEGSLAERYQTRSLLELDIATLQSKFRRWAAAFFLLAFFALFFARRAVGKVLRPDKRLPPNRQLADDLTHALELTAEERYLASVESQARNILGHHWNVGDGSRRWEVLQTLVQWVEDFRQAVRSFLARQRNAELDEGQRSRLRLLAGEESSVQVKGSEARSSLEAFVGAHDTFAQKLKDVAAALALDQQLAFGEASEPAYLDRVRERLRSWSDAGTQLRDWSHYVRARNAAAEAGLDPLLRAHLAGEVPTQELSLSFRRSILESWLNNTIQADPALAAFHSTEHTRLIRKFVDLDGKVRTLAKDVVRARLAERMPDPQSGAAAQSEMGILMRELQKKTRHLPIRKLFARIPTLLRRLKPCLLMSPLSVAQYLGTDYSSFDVVVFDEASQIPTHDAIGAIGRGRQLIVVGDPKQLPPTTFFSRVGEEDTAPSEDDIDELESILDECMAAGLPRMRLGWHYRSRHESLITFSNFNYYENSLHTFPSATESRELLGVSWRPVPHGHYDKSKSRTNRAEADAVVAEVVKRLLDPELQKWSIGVVTFSAAQQELIEDLLDEARRQRPEIEPFFGSAVEEPLFVKNLENVQGDERDSMLFSVCYGPDRDGTVSMNFGPLNRTGGERRLNVAITRARFQLLVFSTLTPDKIDLSRTRAVGVRHLKTFLDYAARGPRAIAEAAAPGQGDFDSPFEQAVHRALVERGWEVHTQVGCSSYRIDLAVPHPELKGHYLLGIECDGANYHSAKCARDRDRLREAVLKGLGWHLHRIWSSDWWHDPKRELEKVEEALRKAKAEYRAARLTGAWSTRAPDPARSAPPDPPKEAPRALFAHAAKPAARPQPKGGTPYPEIPEPGWRGSADDFYSTHMEHKVRTEIRHVMAREAPIHVQVLARRVLACFDLKRATARAMTRLEELIRREGAVIVDGFVWSPDQDRSAYDGFRFPTGQPEQQRKLQEVAPEELANAALAILQQNISLPAEDLARETSRLLGFARTGKQIEAGMKEGIQVLERRGQCQVVGGVVKLV